jgi:hypothetical protein
MQSFLRPLQFSEQSEFEKVFNKNGNEIFAAFVSGVQLNKIGGKF